MAWGPFFLSAGTIGVHLDARAIERHGFDLDLDDLPGLHSLKDLIQDAALGPAHHTGVDRVPGSKLLGEAPPFAALFGDIQDGIEDLEVGEPHITALNREAMGNLLVLGFADFHARIIPEYVLTGPGETSGTTSPATENGRGVSKAQMNEPMAPFMTAGVVETAYHLGQELLPPGLLLLLVKG